MTTVILFDILFFLIGICIGSFLNVCIVRMPYEKSIVRPRSHCQHCKKMIPWYDNTPLISYLVLRGRCRFCGEKFSFRYFFVELLTGIVFVIYFNFFGMDILLAPYLFMTCCFIVATLVDFQHRIIPDEISVGGMFAGLVFSLLIPQLHHVPTPSDPIYLAYVKSLGYSLLGVLVGGGITYAIGILGEFIFKKEAMGGGDIKLMAMIGAFLGWKLSLLTFFLAPFFGVVSGIIEKIRTKDSTIAYGPFLVMGAIISLFWGEEIIVWWLHFMR